MHGKGLMTGKLKSELKLGGPLNLQNLVSAAQCILWLLQKWHTIQPNCHCKWQVEGTCTRSMSMTSPWLVSLCRAPHPGVGGEDAIRVVEVCYRAKEQIFLYLKGASDPKVPYGMMMCTTLVWLHRHTGSCVRVMFKVGWCNGTLCSCTCFHFSLLGPAWGIQYENFLPSLMCNILLKGIHHSSIVMSSISL